MQIGFIGAGLVGLAEQTMAVFDKAVAAGHGEKRLSRLLDPKLNQD